SAAKAKIIAISTGVIVVSSLIALLLALSITRPIRHLAGVAEKVAAGDLSLRSKIEKSDEIGLLSRSFDKMVTHLERILMEQKLFLTDTSHELLTPVTVIKGHLQVLQRSTGASLEEQKTTYDTVLSELDRIERVLNNLLDLARSTSRDLLNLSSVDLPEFLMNVFKKAEILGKRNWYLGEIPEVKITVDRDLLTGALLNLLRNAVAHTKERDQIALSAHINGRYLQFVVVDTGEGIPEKDIPKIFERFYKGSNSSGGRKPGTGLGLSIVKAVAEVHGGSVSVVSRVGSGSTFYLSIPL
ncbi:MAG: sensor histidine kinase, partial [Candidatus Zixiibacteriota bacterium]